MPSPSQTEQIITNPTKFLGNLLIALGLMQRAAQQSASEGIGLTLVLDDSFRPLLEPLFPSGNIIYYPRRELARAGSFNRAGLYLKLLREIRRRGARTALDIEGDSVSRTLTRLSGASRRIGPPDCLRPDWYDEVAPLREGPSEYFRYRAVLGTVFDVNELPPHYGSLSVPAVTESLTDRLTQQGVSLNNSLVLLHTGASKRRKLWAVEKWLALIAAVRQRGLQPVLIGAGAMDRETNAAINNGLTEPAANLTDALSLLELAQLMGVSTFYVGNDSGPMHLATALGLPGIALFGPTKDAIWGPLLPSTQVLRGYSCPESCRNGHDCQLDLRCLGDLQAAQVIAAMDQAIG